MISFEVTGSFASIKSALESMRMLNVTGILQAAGKEGIAALSSVTPVETGLAAHSWDYEISVENGAYSIWWTNSDIENGFPVVIMLQYGHGTRSGGYVSGRDFINPAIRPVFDRIAERVWKVVTSA